MSLTPSPYDVKTKKRGYSLVFMSTCDPFLITKERKIVFTALTIQSKLSLNSLISLRRAFRVDFRTSKTFGEALASDSVILF